MILGLSVYFILMNFYIFSVFGWMFETAFDSIRSGKFVNRGFLVGPILPLYGIAATLVYLLLRPLEDHPSILYVCGMILATAIEYVTGFLLEKIFHVKYWDYTGEPYSFQGRVALIPSLFWGFLSIFLFDVLEPFAIDIIDAIPEDAGRLILAVLLVITLIDLVYTTITTIDFRKQLETLHSFRMELERQLRDIGSKPLSETMSAPNLNISAKLDNTLQKLKSIKKSDSQDLKLNRLEEHIKNYMEKYSSFEKKHPFTGNRRIFNAFPNMKLISKNRSATKVKDILGDIGQKRKPND